MELMYPTLLIVTIVTILVVIVIGKKNKTEFTNGKKVANTKYIKETEYYKAKLKKYKLLSNVVIALNIICILVSGILASRLVKRQTKSDEKYNRDIILSLDISTSECEVNLEFVKQFRQILSSLEGDRIGIILYNTSPVVYCPLTDDYNFIDEKLEYIEKQLDIVVKNNGDVPYSFDDEGLETYTFWYGGTIARSDERGSSLVGDGLAGTVYSFPDLKTNTERTRIIIFATDNDVAGTELVSLDDASYLCKKYNINLYAYCPTVQMNKYTSEEKIALYKKAVEQKAGGKFYTGDIKQMTSSILNEIKDTKTSLLKMNKKTIITDYPEFLFISIIVIYLILIFIEKRIR